MPKVVMLGPGGDPQDMRRRLDESWEVVALPDDADAAALDAALRDADAIIAFAIERDLPPTPRLRLVQVTGAGYDRIPRAA